HTYADAHAVDVRTITVTVADSANQTASATAHATVSNVAPTLHISGAGAVTPDTMVYTLALSHSDPGQDTLSGWVLNWGDGTVQAVAGNATSVTHQYALVRGNYMITATATDEDGTFAANALSVSARLSTPARAWVAQAFVDLTGTAISLG